MDYYNEIKNRILDNEIYSKVKDYSKKRNKVITYFEIWKLLNEAGSKYGEGIIKEYSDKLMIEIGKKFNISGRTIRAINIGECWFDETLSYPIRPQFISSNSSTGNTKNYCKKCGKEIYKGSTYCTQCFHLESRTCERPSREELKHMIRTTSFTTIGKQYGVTDNTIRK